MTAATLPRRRLSGLREFGSSVATIMSKELRSRFRGRRAYLVLTVYLAILALIAYGAYMDTAPTARAEAQFGGGLDGLGSTAHNASATVGQAIFAVLSVFQLLLVGFLAPAFTTGAISLEREKHTLDLLITTPMRPGAIVVGKLLSALAFVALLILAAIPVSGLVLMYGGASLEDIGRQQVVLFVSAIGFGVIGLFFSALTKRTQTATVLTYSTLLFLTVGTFFIWRFWTAAAAASSDAPFGPTPTAPQEILYLNPAVAMIEIVADTEIEPGDFTKIMAEIRGYSGYVCDGDICFPTEGGGGGGIDFPVPITKPLDVNGDLACPPNARCAAPPGRAAAQAADEAAAAAEAARTADARAADATGVPLLAAATTQAAPGHFWPRFTLTFGAVSVLLTLVSMRLVVPMPLRIGFRRRRPAAIPAGPTSPAAGQSPDEGTER